MISRCLSDDSHSGKICLSRIPIGHLHKSQGINHSISALATLKGPHLIEGIQNFNQWRYPFINIGIDLDEHLFMESMIWTLNFNQGEPCCLPA